VEFEQIYDEYITLCNDDDDLDLEMISLSKLLRSFIFTVEEKEAIINGELAGYLTRLEMADLEQLIHISETVTKKSTPADETAREDAKEAEFKSPRDDEAS